MHNAFMFESNVYTDTPQRLHVNGNVPLSKWTWIWAMLMLLSRQHGLKMQNGRLVDIGLVVTQISIHLRQVVEVMLALVFNVAQPTTEEMVTSNDNINNVEGVSVSAGTRYCNCSSAAGKSVVITNILGKVVAETVLTSDNATIAVPAGIVAVAVDGEEAVKTIVK